MSYQQLEKNIKLNENKIQSVDATTMMTEMLNVSDRRQRSHEKNAATSSHKHTQNEQLRNRKPQKVNTGIRKDQVEP